MTVTEMAGRQTAVVAAATRWQKFPTLCKELLDEVWTCLRAGGVHSGCPNVMLYRDDMPNAEVGVELRQPRPVGPQWEVYGPHHDDPAELMTEVHWLLSERPSTVDERRSAAGDSAWSVGGGT